MGDKGASCLQWVHVSRGPAAYSRHMGVQLLTALGYMKAGGSAAYMYMGQGCNYLQWAHGMRGSSCLQWVHGGGGPAAYRGYMRAGGSSGQGFQSSAYIKAVGSAAYNRHVGEGVQLLTVGTWRQGLQCAYMYMRAGGRGSSYL